MRRRLLEKPREDRVSRREWATALSATKRSSKRTEKCQMEAVGDLSKSCLGGQMEARLKRGIVNLVNYSWHDLIEEANKYETKMSMWKKQDALQSSSSTIIVDKISNYPRTERHEENLLMKTKRDWHHFVSINPMKKIHVVGQKQYSQIFQESHLPFVIHFSLSSKICLENGWIFHYPHTKLEILKWKTVLDIAVKKLQEAIIRIKTEAAKLKKEGFNKQLILRHYNDPKPEAEVDNSPLGSQYFWLELLKGKPQMPAVQQDDPAMKKFHYALIDGSSMI
ncbi:uncharacterized protein [Myotis yumanensis]|uniref:uncharacterized protein isoform X2 n=1 Tax=Myotis yumanensis TaxID=159337 RepID=UPI0038D238D6